MKKNIKLITTALAFSLMLTTGVAMAADEPAYPVIYVNGTMMNDEGYGSINRLKPIITEADQSQQLRDYVNEIVMTLPVGTALSFAAEESEWESVLTGEDEKITIKRLVFATTEDCAEYMRQQQTVENHRPTALWQVQSWPTEAGFHYRGLLYEAGADSVVEVLMDFALQPQQEMIDGYLDQLRPMSIEEKQAHLQTEPIVDLKKIRSLDISQKQLIDYANGYVATIPQDMTIDANLGDICTIFSNDECQVEIYTQPLDGAISAATYKNYSNLFLKNTIDHTQQQRTSTTINGMKAQIITWKRPTLSKVENDKPYYLSVDLIRDKNKAYTLIMKTKQPLSEGSLYSQIVSSFALINPIGETTPGGFIEKNTVNPDAKPMNYAKWNNETKHAYDQYFGAKSSLTWGIFEPNAPKDFYGLKQLENQVGQEFKFLIHYQHLPTENALTDVTTVLNNAYREKRIVELTLQTTDMGRQAGNTVYRILDGNYDEFLQQYAKRIADFGHPVLFRLCNEMNGDWCQYSSFHTSKDALMYQELYRYIYSIFEQQGANKNTLWVWNPNERSFPDFSWNDARMYYPGNDVVDLVGLTGYNTGNYYKGEVWRSFDEIYKPLYQEYVTTYDKPFMITEFGSSSFGGDKSQWIEEMFASIKTMDKIKVAIWWSGCDWESPGVPARIYYMNESPEILATFNKMFAQEKAQKK